MPYCKDCNNRKFTGGIPAGTPPYVCKYGATSMRSDYDDACSRYTPKVYRGDPLASFVGSVWKIVIFVIVVFMIVSLVVEIFS